MTEKRPATGSRGTVVTNHRSPEARVRGPLASRISYMHGFMGASPARHRSATATSPRG
jgi:hypothetical protein